MSESKRVSRRQFLGGSLAAANARCLQEVQTEARRDHEVGADILD
ncbi:MAG: hypothetical protein NTY65_17930 [Planctomycetota bacterium]|nr:hypothetical protein [Planctomycetota bacterium]